MQPNADIRDANLATINAQTFASRFSSKMEIVNFLLYDVEAYLAPRHTVNVFFLRDLIVGKVSFLTSFVDQLQKKFVNFIKQYLTAHF